MGPTCQRRGERACAAGRAREPGQTAWAARSWAEPEAVGRVRKGKEGRWAAGDRGARRRLTGERRAARGGGVRELGPRLGCWRGSGSGRGKEKRWVGLLAGFWARLVWVLGWFGFLLILLLFYF